MAILKIHIISDLSQFSFVFNQSESVTEITPSHKMWMLAVVTPFQITVILLYCYIIWEIASYIDL